jgi:hypothetical protein
MDFFASQDAARRKTAVLIVYFGLAVASIVAAVYVAFMGLLLYGHVKSESSASFAPWNPGLFAVVAAGVVLVVFSGS